jgi:hypothetical protein
MDGPVRLDAAGRQCGCSGRRGHSGRQLKIPVLHICNLVQ